MIDPNSQFFAILTATGEAKQANADALGIPWKLTGLGVGDANGTDPIPDRAQKKLINERRRRPLNQLSVDPANPNIIVAEQIIPADEGGWWIREIGLYDADGDLVAVANCAPSYKPLMSQGAGRTQVVRMNFIVSSAANVVLKIDPDVVLASRKFVTESIAEAINKQDQKQSVLVATTGPIQLAGALTIDGVPVPAASRVLVKNQAQAKDNGLYLTGDIWTRTTDADVSTEVTPGLLVHVEKGLTNGDSVWQLVTDAPITLGTTDLVFEMAIGRTGSAGTYRSVSVDKNGRVVGGTNPSTLAESGIEEPVNRLFPFRGVRVFAQAGVFSFVPPAGVFSVLVEVWGAGGAGGAAAKSASGGGGGAGGHGVGLYPVTPGVAVSISVGEGGTIDLNLQSSGLSGGASSFGSFLTALGGNGGDSYYMGSGGGEGGRVLGANAGAWKGQDGGSGVYFSAPELNQSSTTGGIGGGPSGGRGGAGNGSGSDGVSSLPGGTASGGGGGGSSTQVGGASLGGAGMVIIKW